jgi:hypothetical protein
VSDRRSRPAGDFRGAPLGAASPGVSAREIRTADEVHRTLPASVIPGASPRRSASDGGNRRPEEAIRDVARRGDPVLGTCAGAIPAFAAAQESRGSGSGMSATATGGDASHRGQEAAVASSLSRGRANADVGLRPGIHKAALDARRTEACAASSLHPPRRDLLRRIRPRRPLSRRRDFNGSCAFSTRCFSTFPLSKPLVAALTGHAVAGGAAPRGDRGLSFGRQRARSACRRSRSAFCSSTAWRRCARGG